MGLRTRRATGRKRSLAAGARPKPTQAWKLLLAVADRHERKLAKRVEVALEGDLSAVNFDMLEAALDRRDAAHAERIAMAAFPEADLADLSAHAPTAELRDAADEPTPLSETLLDIMQDAGDATRCSVRPTLHTPDTVHDTMTLYKTSPHQWAPERQRLHDEIIRNALHGVRPSAEPTIFMTGGGPASGKSTMLQSGNVTVPGHQSAVAIDADAIKKQLPEFDRLVAAGDSRAAAFVHEESSYLSKRIATEAVTHNLDVVFDTTGDGSIENLTSKIAPFRGNGHKVVAYYATNDLNLALRLASERGIATGRFIPQTFLRETHAGVSRTLPEAVKRGLFDEVFLYDTNVRGSARLVMSARGSHMTIHNEALWEDFLAKGR